MLHRLASAGLLYDNPRGGTGDKVAQQQQQSEATLKYLIKQLCFWLGEIKGKHLNYVRS